jgi:hypothetical protein
MTRRAFVKISGLPAATAGVADLNLPGREATAAAEAQRLRGLLAPVDLPGRIRLAQNALLGILDTSRRHLPYWNCEFDQGDLQYFKHAPYDGEAVWDRLHNSGRVLHGLTMAEAVTGWRTDPVIIADLTHHLVGVFSAGDGLPGDSDTKDGKRVVSLHNLREALNGLTALIKRGDPQATPLARQLVRRLRESLDDEGRLRPEWLPSYVGAYSSQPHMEGRTVDALVRYHRVSRDEVALETAGLITAFALRHCFSADGALTPLAGTHGHSINVLVAGMLDYALETKDAALLDRVRQAFDVGLASFNSSFGWSMESLHRPVLRGEANNTGDLLRAALLLGRAGWPEYYGRAERILRAHLLPSQLTEVQGYSDDPQATEDHRRSLASRCLGGFALPTPNDLQVNPQAPLHVCDITSGALDALCEAHRATVQEDATDTRVHLLWDAQTAHTGVRSALSREGRVEITSRGGRNLWVRLPAWVPPAAVTVSVNGAPVELHFAGPYVVVAGTAMPQSVSVEFPLREERTVETIVDQPFTIDWRGTRSWPCRRPPRQARARSRCHRVRSLCLRSAVRRANCNCGRVRGRGRPPWREGSQGVPSCRQASHMGTGSAGDGRSASLRVGRANIWA